MGQCCDSGHSDRAKSVVIVSTSASDFAGHMTGLWLEDIASAYYCFKERGFDITVASVAGGEIPIDPASREGGFYTARCEQFDGDPEAQKLVRESAPLAGVVKGGVLKHDALYLAGGHGACADFPGNRALADAVEAMYNAGRVVAAVGHGPLALLGCRRADGEPLAKGLQVTGSTNDEEEMVNLLDKCEEHACDLEARLGAEGGKFQAGPAWDSNVCVAGNLVTGQNSQSSEDCAKRVVALLCNLVVCVQASGGG